MYAPLLRDQARQMNVPAGNRSELVTTVLDDVAVHLNEVRFPPRDLTRYVVAALRNRVRTRHRDGIRREAKEECAYATLPVSGERVVAESHSAYGLACAQPPGRDVEPPLSAAIARLADMSASVLTAQESALMIGIGRRMPMREIAVQIGISYGAARVRVHRLRERFLELATQYVESLQGDEQQELRRFFRRAGITLTRPYAAETEARHPNGATGEEDQS